MVGIDPTKFALTLILVGFILAVAVFQSRGGQNRGRLYPNAPDIPKYTAHRVHTCWGHRQTPGCSYPPGVPAEFS